MVLGLFGTPWPKKVPVDIVVGEPIDVPVNLSYTEEQVDLIHSTYIEALEKLYEKHKHLYHSSDRPLVIIDAEL